MIAVRYNAGAQRNARIEALQVEGDNLRWLARAEEKLGSALDEARVLLVGGSDRAHFELRVAQAPMRSDRLPSCFSHALVLHGPGARLASHVPLLPTRLADVHARNGIEEADLSVFADPHAYPNVALLAFPTRRAGDLGKHVAQLRHERMTTDLVAPLAAWLGYLLGTAGAPSPLATRTPIASALFVDEVLARVGVDVVPGLAERAASPEAIWQAVLWWGDVYAHVPLRDDDAVTSAPDAARAPRGHYCIRARHATLCD